MYGRENFDKVKSIILNKREEALAAAERRNEEVREASPKIREIDSELAKTGLLIFKTACAGGNVDSIKKRNLELQKARGDELIKLGFSRDYTDVHYSCEICEDTGFTETEMCTCMKKMIINANVLSSGIGALIEKQSFDNFDLDWYKDNPEIYESMKNNLKVVKKYATEFKLPTAKNMLILGTTGTGKTHVTTAIAKIVIEKGYEVLYDSAQNIIDAFENDKFRHGYGQYEPQGQKYLDCDLLIIDDLGTEFQTQFSLSALYNILNTRQNRSLPTIISTNLQNFDFNALYEDRIYSRIVGRGSIILKFQGRDYRINHR